MRHYLYDGTFEGLLSVIYTTFHQRVVPDGIFPEKRDEPNLFAEKIHITTDLQQARKVEDAIRDKISPEALKTVFYTYLSELEGAEVAIFQYLKLGFQLGERVDRHISDERVMRVHRARQKVGTECHRLLGLLRFRKLEGELYYAPVEPDHHVICLLAPHFKARLADQNWIIHDKKRNLAVMYNQKEWMVTDVTTELTLTYDEEEELYQTLWQGFFESIAIEDRINPKLQRSKVPARYWPNLIEKIGPL